MAAFTKLAIVPTLILCRSKTGVFAAIDINTEDGRRVDGADGANAC